jgi:hypothetical protein
MAAVIAGASAIADTECSTSENPDEVSYFMGSV